ncbi:MAG: AraC family transcriptional regulator [Chitinophagia bacterium]|nr:AraC family transcriptional regulator [Chitinophagia bacterium]
MKRFILIFTSIIIISLGAIYIFIPSRITITSAAIAAAPDVAIERVLMEEAHWPAWWKYCELSKFGSPNLSQPPFTLTLKEKFYKSLQFDINAPNQPTVSSRLTLVPLRKDSTGFEWSCQLEAGNNPIQRLLNYGKAREIKSLLDSCLQPCVRFFSNTENVYGIQIERTKLPDTLFVTAKKQFGTKPSQQDIYNLIKQIEGYIKTQGSKPSGSSIYNISQLTENQFQLMAGVPISLRIKENKPFEIKYMVPGSFLVTEVVGGEYSVQHSARQLKQYFQDYKKTSMAMSFTMLVTDRSLQPDSSRWITRLYEPVY